jgi:predicted nucleic acid-binding protein
LGTNLDWGAYARLGSSHPTVSSRALTVLVIDASVALAAASVANGFKVFGKEELVAPPLLWSEARSVLHETAWRREISKQQAHRTLEALDGSPIKTRWHEKLGLTSWRVADEMGWAKTYDAEYVGLAQLLGCRLVTLDARLRRGADRLGLVVALDEL